MKSKLLVAIEWLWNCRGRNLYINPQVLTNLNSQDTSAPELSLVEAMGVFKFLIEKDLIYPAKQQGNTVYLMNEVKEREWRDSISELRKPKWRRSKSLKKIALFTLWFMSLIITSFLGALFKEAGEDFYQTHIKSSEVEQKNLENNNNGEQDSSSPQDSTQNNQK